MTIKNFQPLTLGRVEEGELVREFNRAFRLQQEKLIEHVDRYGEKAKGASAEITLKVTVKCRDPEAGLFTAKTSMSKKDPQRPARTTTAFARVSDDEQAGLFVRASGSTEGDPTQLVLSTQDGRAIDAETGEAVERTQEPVAGSKGGDA